MKYLKKRVSSPQVLHAVKRVNRTYKDGMFRMLFNEEEKLRELYNALKGTNYGSETAVDIRTLKSAIYLDLKNDLAFSIGDQFLLMTEHQSTLCSNMPIRMAEYFGKLLGELVGNQVYKESIMKIPTPEFYVFYNGTKDCPSSYRLSENFTAKASENSAELVVKVININYTKGAEILKRCQTMKEYSRFVYLVSEHRKANTDLEAAVKKAILQCKKENVLSEFLQKHGAEVLSMLFTEVTREEYGDIRAAEGEARGEARGEAKSVIKLLSRFGTMPPGLEQSILQESDSDRLTEWLLLAAAAKDINAFLQKMK